MPKSLCSSFIALIPKRENPQNLDDFRPISLIGCIYKVVSKLLAARLSLVIGKLVSTYQTTFISGRQILDGVVVANKLIDFATRNKKSCLLLKVDFAQAYECVDLGFLQKVFLAMNFGVKWMHWMRGAVFNSYLSVLVNGSTTKDFKATRGLRQEDLLSIFVCYSGKMFGLLG